MFAQISIPAFNSCSDGELPLVVVDKCPGDGAFPRSESGHTMIALCTWGFFRDPRAGSSGCSGGLSEMLSHTKVREQFLGFLWFRPCSFYLNYLDVQGRIGSELGCLRAWFLGGSVKCQKLMEL